ncbi:MAG TPA: TonB-dependent receptor, partial [Puia sp.]|nr:TonB-dependent receptor [Puia sp.]
TTKTPADTAIETLQNVIILSTRTNQLLKNIPIAVQVVGREDIEEGTAQSPANIRELLTELSGTQLQQTSAVSGNVSIRLQGLDGRYTQLLKDGFPLYGGFSGSLGILQVPPLDLHQVEVIKGAGSALYGGDAIAGIINLISRQPDTTPHLDAIENQTQRGETDLGGFYSKRNRHFGWTVMGTASRQTPVDVNNDGFTDLPQIRQGTIAPTFFWYPDSNTTVRFGINLSAERRTGGDLYAVQHTPDSLHPFRQRNSTDRDYYQLSITHKAKNGQTFTLKNSIGYFYRSIGQSSGASSYRFTGAELSSFSELSYTKDWEANQFVAGTDLITDRFTPTAPDGTLKYAHTTAGLFAQDDWTIAKKLILETGVRADQEYTLYLLPRLALLYKPLRGLSARVGGGLAYKLPTVFNAQDEEEGYLQVRPIAPTVNAERSGSVNLSLNYQGRLTDEITIAIDQNFYYTRLENALIPNTDSLLKGWLVYYNAPGPVVSRGSETNARFTLDDLSLYLGYSLTDARRRYLPGNPRLPLTPRSKLVAGLTWESEPHWKAGAEAFFTGSQYLDNGQKTQPFQTFDLMVQHSWGPFSILLNVENVTDTRQSRFGPLYTGTMQDPVFKEVYAPLEGRIFSVAFRYSK